MGAGLLLQSFARLVNADLGFLPGNTVALQVFAWDRQAGEEARASFFRETRATGETDTEFAGETVIRVLK